MQEERFLEELRRAFKFSSGCCEAGFIVYHQDGDIHVNHPIQGDRGSIFIKNPFGKYCDRPGMGFNRPDGADVLIDFHIHPRENILLPSLADLRGMGWFPCPGDHISPLYILARAEYKHSTHFLFLQKEKVGTEFQEKRDLDRISNSFYQLRKSYQNCKLSLKKIREEVDQILRDTGYKVLRLDYKTNYEKAISQLGKRNHREVLCKFEATYLHIPCSTLEEEDIPPTSLPNGTRVPWDLPEGSGIPSYNYKSLPIYFESLRKHTSFPLQNIWKPEPSIHDPYLKLDKKQLETGGNDKISEPKVGWLVFKSKSRRYI